nr:MAG TPA: hypothetical protein [Caudoviricetes sp.]
MELTRGFYHAFLWRLLGQVQNRRQGSDIIIHNTTPVKSQRQIFA